MADESKFQVGQRVRATVEMEGDMSTVLAGTEGVVTKVYLDHSDYDVMFEPRRLYVVSADEIEAIDEQPPADTPAAPPMCPICGNYPVEPGYRVCPSCVAAREHAPHYWLDELPDKIEPAAPPEPAEYEMDMTCPICGAGDHDCEHFMLPDGTFNQDAFDDSLNERRIQRGLTPLEIPSDVLLEINGKPLYTEQEIAETVGVLALQSAYGAMVEELERELAELRAALEATQKREKAYASALDKLVDSIPAQYSLENPELAQAFAIAALTLDEMTRAASEPGAALPPALSGHQYIPGLWSVKLNRFDGIDAELVSENPDELARLRAALAEAHNQLEHTLRFLDSNRNTIIVETDEYGVDAAYWECYDGEISDIEKLLRAAALPPGAGREKEGE